MNMKFIDRVIASYNDKLDEADKARLAFFRGMWDEMDRWSSGPLAAVNAYEFPAPEVAQGNAQVDKPVFSYAAVVLNRNRLIALFDALRTYVVRANMLNEEDAQALEKVPFDSLLSDSLLQKAGSHPSLFLEDFAEALEQAGYEGGTLRLGVLVAMLALRVEFEPIARKVADILPQGDNCHHHSLTCPVCGSAPALARVGGESSPTDGRGKVLYCQQCGSVWDFERIRCARCGTRNQGNLHYFNIEGDDGHRIATCDECGKYIRTIFVEESLAPFSFEVEEVVTARLDAIAHDPRFFVSEKKVTSE